MSIKYLFCGLVMALTATAATAAVTHTSDSQPLHRGDYLEVILHSGAVYNLRLRGSDEVSLNGTSGTLSMHLLRADIASIRHQAPPYAAASQLNASTAAFGLLCLSVASQGASQNFGAGQACNGNSAAC